MEEIILHWVIALAVVLLIFAGMYIVVKLAVKKAFTEIARDLAKKVWEEDKKV